MDCFQAMINERKRREMEAEMNRFEQEISSRPVYNNFGVNQSMSSSTVHFIPHQIQRQLPRTHSSHNQMQTSYESQHQQNSNNYVINSQTTHSSNSNANQMGFPVNPMSGPNASQQTSSVVSNPNTSQTNTNSTSSGYKKSKNNSTEKGKKVKKMLRMAGGTIWEDSSLLEWGNDDFRIFCGDLGNDVTDDVLARAFNRFSSFTKAKVIRDKRNNKSKGYGFVSFKDPQDFARAIKEMNGKYVGSRPIKLRKSMWKDRNYDVVRKKIKTKHKLGLI